MLHLLIKLVEDGHALICGGMSMYLYMVAFLHQIWIFLIKDRRDRHQNVTSLDAFPPPLFAVRLYVFNENLQKRKSFSSSLSGKSIPIVCISLFINNPSCLSDNTESLYYTVEPL